MILTIQLHKHAHKPSILKCIRADKSITWSKLQPSTEYHDLAHIVIEKTLELKNSFYGLIAQGVDIGDFELPEDQRQESLKSDHIPKESIVTEHLVNLLTIEYFNSDGPIHFITETQKIVKENSLPFPENLTEETLTILRTEFAHLVSLWENLKNGDYLEKNLII